jgi:DNA-binding MarR family transcriptional regulator
VARKPQPERLEFIYDKIEEYPGERPGAIARILGWHRSQVTRSLPALEERGYLLSEDDHGRLWPFRRRS